MERFALRAAALVVKMAAEMRVGVASINILADG
jgi:hypothetical protein